MNGDNFYTAQAVPISMPKEQGRGLLDSISLWVIVGLIFLLPIFFIPSTAVSFQFTKTVLFFLGTALPLILFIIARLKEGALVLPRNLIVLSAWGIPLAYLLSSLFTDKISLSLFGERFESDTFAFMLMGTLLLTLTTLLVREQKQVLRLYVALLISLGIITLYQVIRLFGGIDALSFGVFGASTDNLIGRWNDLAIFFGLALTVGMLTLSGIRLNPLYRILVYLVLVGSLFFLALINFLVVWIVVSLAALCLFIYTLLGKKLHVSEFGEQKEGLGNRVELLVVTFVVLLIGGTISVQTVFSPLGSPTIGNYLSTTFNITQLEARPSWQSTMDILKNTYGESPILGSGPNTFTRQWAQYRPIEVNESVFWSADFNVGIGLIPTSFVTTGILGILAWLLFLGSLIYVGFRTFIKGRREDRMVRYLTLSSFAAATYLWILCVLYVPSVAITVLTFFATGLFVATMRLGGESVDRTVSLSRDSRLAFVGVLGLVVVCLVAIALLYGSLQRYVSFTYYQRAVSARTDGDLDTAEQYIDRAMRLGKSDSYYRLATDISLARLSQVVTQTGVTTEELRSQFQSALAKTLQFGEQATNFDQNDYQNWVVKGRIYHSIVPLNIEGAYDNAKKAYERALILNPGSPVLELFLSQLEFAHQNVDGAREHINKAIALKSNYSQAMFFLSQIEATQGNIDKAVESAAAGAVLEPNNPVAFFRLGILYYQAGTIDRAAQALERAIDLNRDYANARYFLGLSYFEQGRVDDAILQFERIAELNPDNDEVKIILGNLKSGKAPFTGIAGGEPENRSTLPLDE